LTGAHDQYERQRLADRRVVEPEQQSHILALATSFPVVWNDPNACFGRSRSPNTVHGDR
jgi:hypothetical protein